jgi:hypothetical protein
MCRNIKILFNFDPPATEEEIRAASLQYVRKVSGYNKPSSANDLEFQRAVDEVATATQKLLDTLITKVSPKDREVEKEKAKARSANRFGTS